GGISLKRKITWMSIVFIFVYLFANATPVWAGLGDFEYDDGGLAPTEQQKGHVDPDDSGDHGVKTPSKDDRHWWEKDWDKTKDLGGKVKNGFIDAKDAVVDCAADL